MSKPGTIIPIRGAFESTKALLHSVAEDEEISSFVVISFRKDGSTGRAQINMTRQEMAFAALIVSDWARKD